MIYQIQTPFCRNFLLIQLIVNIVRYIQIYIIISKFQCLFGKVLKDFHMRGFEIN